MRKWICCLSLFSFILIGCQSNNEYAMKTEAKVIEQENESIIVDIDGANYIIPSTNVDGLQLEIGDRIIISHNGIIMESEPAQFSEIFLVEKK